jgi:hypothetical protein
MAKKCKPLGVKSDADSVPSPVLGTKPAAVVVVETPVQDENGGLLPNADAGGTVEGDSLPLPQRLVSKTWSVRRDVYDQLMQTFLSRSHCHEQVVDVRDTIKTILGDSHGGAQVSGVEMMEQWMLCLDSSSISDSLVSEVVTLVTDKVFPQSVRAQTAGTSLIVSLAKAGGSKNLIVDALVAGCKNKKKKVPPECLKTVTALILEYGVLALPVKTVISCLNDCFQSVDNVLKSAASDLACEMYKFMREPLKSMVWGSCRYRYPHPPFIVLTPHHAYHPAAQGTQDVPRERAVCIVR